MTLPWWLTTLIGAISATIVSFFVGYWYVGHLKAEQAAALASQIKFDISQCQDSKNITTNADKTYEDLYNAASLELNRLRSQPATCVHVTKSTSSGHATHKPNKPHNSDGISSQSLYDYAGQAETDRIKVITLQQFILDERKK